jgi:hypothetical protein
MRKEITVAKVNNLGAAKPNSRMFKRGYTINLMSNVPNEKPAAETKPPAKKNSGKK